MALLAVVDSGTLGPVTLEEGWLVTWAAPRIVQRPSRGFEYDEWGNEVQQH
jgi:hypothetical protein